MQTKFGKTVGFSMRSFRFTSDGTTGDNSTQQQRISCDITMTPASNDVPNQASACNCYTKETCEPWTFTPGTCTRLDHCDNGLNLCSLQRFIEGSSRREGDCINCQNLRTVKACREKVNAIYKDKTRNNTFIGYVT